MRWPVNPRLIRWKQRTIVTACNEDAAILDRRGCSVKPFVFHGSAADGEEIGVVVVHHSPFNNRESRRQYCSIPILGKGDPTNEHR